MSLIRLIMILLLVVVAGCTSVDPYTGEQKTSNTAKGAGIGALSGAILGAAVSKDKKKGALVGALAGGAIGGGVGHYMDQQEKELGDDLRGTGVQVRREGDTLRLIMPGNITFTSGHSELRSDFYPVLNSVSKVLVKFDQTAIKVSGHTDSTGSESVNQTLSEGRADSVGQYLISRGIKQGRVQMAGYGSRYPLTSNTTPQGREQNRRVELELQPL